jgi:cyclopropane-fatty-acyl-phospholipid synthase
VFQIQLAKQIDTVPITRGYIEAEEERLRGRERRSLPPLRMAGE